MALYDTGQFGACSSPELFRSHDTNRGTLFRSCRVSRTICRPFTVFIRHWRKCSIGKFGSEPSSDLFGQTYLPVEVAQDPLGGTKGECTAVAPRSALPVSSSKPAMLCCLKTGVCWSEFFEMKEGYSPLFYGLAMASFSALFWYIDARQNHEAELLALEVKTFLENHRTESSNHLTAYQQARQLSLSTQSPNRMLLSMFSLVIAVQFFSAFFQNPKGREIAKEFSRAWTWRP